MSSIDPADKLIVALDVPGLDEALHLIGLLEKQVRFFKVGLALFTRVGPAGIMRLKKEGIKLFLDLKFHDIPAVVREAASSSNAMGADMITVHSAGGREMMMAAVVGAGEHSLEAGAPPPVVLGVTVLTSLNEGDLSAVGYEGGLEDAVGRLAMLSSDAGLGGIVASAGEAKSIRRVVKRDFVIVTPGIRPAGSDHTDQKRVATPAEALRAGSDYLVVGRPITLSPDPAAAAADIIREMEEA